MTKTVKCRISLAVDQKGCWCAAGTESDKGKFCDFILDSVEPGESRFFVDVEVPIPETPTVHGTVTKIEGQP